MKKCTTLLLILILTFFQSSCGLIFDPTQNNKVGRDLRPKYQVNDVFVYSSNIETREDSIFVSDITKYYYDDDDYEEIRVVLGDPRLRDNRSFVIQITPDWIGFIYSYYHFPVIYPNEPKQDIKINGVQYEDVYIFEDDTIHGNSDTLIKKLYYHGNIGILGYEYENGNEYLLDTIIKVED